MWTTLSFIGQAFLLVNLILFLTHYANKSKSYQFFTGYLLAVFCIQSVMLIYSEKGWDNLFLSTYFLFFQFILLSGFFYSLFKPIRQTVSRIIGYLSPFIVLCVALQYIFDPALYYTFNILGFFATLIILITYTVLYLHEMSIRKQTFQCACIGLLIYLTSSSLIFVSATSLLSFGDEINALIWEINAFLFIVFQVFVLLEWKQIFFSKKTT